MINIIIFTIVSLEKGNLMVTLHRIQERMYADFDVYIPINEIQEKIAGISGYQFKD